MSSMSENLPNPTGRELEVMQVLWRLESATVREILDDLNTGLAEPLAYTTVLRFLQIMTGKGLVTREDQDRSHVYRASVAPEATKRQIANDLMERVFGGSACELVLHALGGKKVKAAELAGIRDLMNQLEEGGSK